MGFRRLQNTCLVAHSSDGGWDVCASLDLMPTRHMAVVVGDDHSASMSDTPTHTRQTHTTINRDDDNVDNEKRGRATTTIIIIIIVVVATKRETKRRNSCNTAERCSTGWLAGRIVHHRCDNTNDSTCSFTESVVGQKRAWPVESSKECIPKHCQHTRIHKHKQSTEPCS